MNVGTDLKWLTQEQPTEIFNCSCVPEFFRTWQHSCCDTCAYTRVTANAFGPIKTAMLVLYNQVGLCSAFRNTTGS